MALKVFNTLSREKEEFKPLANNRVTMYVCGLTPQDFAHMGHARAYIAYDVIKRYLEYRGYTVIHVQNFTDIDDRIIEKANARGESPLALSSRLIKAFFEDMDRLEIKRANIYPKVTEHVGDIIETIKVLVDKGFAYVSDGDVYFSVTKAPRFGQLSHQSIDDMLVGARVQVEANKRDPMDFALWKKQKPGEIAWQSPWGMGRPGWHIECSTMSIKYLGYPIDIHGGGIDLIFPHHECEILQSEAYTGKSPFVRYWLHNGHVMINKEKMSKSLGNFFTVREVLEKYDAELIRFLLINTHYRSPVDYSDKQFDEAKQGLDRIRNTIESVRARMRALDPAQASSDRQFVKSIEETKQKFLEAMDDDFNTRVAIAVIFEFTRQVNEYLSANPHPSKDVLEKILGTYDEFGQVLGLFQEKEGQASEETVEGLMKFLIELRAKARESKDFATSDKIRDRLKAMGIVLEDGVSGTTWKRA